MSRAEHHTDPALAELERQIAETREQLGQTVEELAAKADVPGRARAKAAETMSRFRLGAHRAEDRTKAAAAQATDRVKHTGGKHGRHGRHGAGKGPDEITGGAAATTGTAAPAGPAGSPGSGGAVGPGDGSGAHRAAGTQDTGATPAGAVPVTVSGRRAHDKERLAYGAAAIGLTAATAGAAVWAARHP